MARRIAIRLNKARDIIEKKKRIHVADLMIQLGYNSMEYFKRSFLPLLRHFYGECIEIQGDYIVWRCAQEEARAELAATA
ncbi:hypothetical protein [Pyrodictium delaneyi]|uniref:HTH araC/xylS-type domain-containing protein n=1 Tax=Pyrodictium delaneyi TaxID=1273541 RepID=A0A211YS28_9CREN|nr:hypothetical protein [Pyrodictium delaneyi]OWJ55627.1 hypothetical protein Pdsh_02235 [Pyrodictium delaneyi]